MTVRICCAVALGMVAACSENTPVRPPPAAADVCPTPLPERLRVRPNHLWLSDLEVPGLDTVDQLVAAICGPTDTLPIHLAFSVWIAGSPGRMERADFTCLSRSGDVVVTIGMHRTELTLASGRRHRLWNSDSPVSITSVRLSAIEPWNCLAVVDTIAYALEFIAAGEAGRVTNYLWSHAMDPRASTTWPGWTVERTASKFKVIGPDELSELRETSDHVCRLSATREMPSK